MEFRNGTTNHPIAVLIILLVFVLAGPVAAKSGTGHAPTQVLAETKQKVLETYGKLPLRFEANRGQADRQVKFLSRGRGSTLFLTSTEAVLTLGNQQGTTTVGSHQPGARPAREEKASVLRMKLVGANPQPRVVGLEELPGKVNYFIGNDPAKWRTNVPTYARVEYRDVYPGVNLVYYGNQRQLEYDFVVGAGADPRAIKVAFIGAKRLRTDAQGDLIVQTGTGDFRMHKPLVYQEIAGVREAIPGKYVLKSVREVGFEIASYDASKPLIVDASGNAHLMGYTSSTDFPTTPGAFQPGNHGGIDTFVAKITEQPPPPLAVVIDIKPGSFPNSINLGSGGTVPVAILSSATFDATTVDPLTVTLASALVKVKGKGTPMASFEDVNGDGLSDLVVHVSTEALELSENDTEAVLEGKTFGGAGIRGTDSIRVVP